ncbi:hypothetical protein BOTCAL_0050g00130 [Botryotinia calthae]|uniref:Hydrophobin n=1 Tax=Botryotinia calthae TaxID=38488 RepID=A0A4Y8DB58_9HELO|nr:hypothetical protein BOTCAL_0050g00130 [Botryotinia calthae]
MHFLSTLTLVSAATTFVAAMASPVSVEVEKRDVYLCNTDRPYYVPYCCPPLSQISKKNYAIFECTELTGSTTITTVDEHKKACNDKEEFALCCKRDSFGRPDCEAVV